jgi:hypothetical protein
MEQRTVEIEAIRSSDQAEAVVAAWLTKTPCSLLCIPPLPAAHRLDRIGCRDMAGWTWTGRWWPDDEGATFAGARFSHVQPCLPAAPHTHPPTHTSTCTRHAAVQSSRDQRPQRPSASTCTRSYFRTLEPIRSSQPIQRTRYEAQVRHARYNIQRSTGHTQSARTHDIAICTQAVPSARKLCGGLLAVTLCSKRPILWCWAARFRSAVN